MLFVLQVEQMLGSEEYGKDLSSVQNLLKKHQLLEADVAAHEVLYHWRYRSLSFQHQSILL